jgi:hypothetical protein
MATRRMAIEMASATRAPWRSLALALLVSLAALAPPAQASGPPQVPATWASDVRASTANLRAEINPGGVPSTYRFEYIAASAYLANLAAQPPREAFSGASRLPAVSDVSVGSGEAPIAVVQHLGGLAAASAYRYRVRAFSSLAPPGGLLGPVRALATQPSAPTFSLPDARAWELVSPPEKNGGDVAAPGALFGGGALQAGADGDSVTYGSAASFAGALGAPGASQYLSARGAGGWSTLNITHPALSGEFGDEPDGVPYRLFSADLARALHLAGGRCGPAQPCPRGLELIDLAGGAVLASPAAPDLDLAGATPDLRHVVLSTCAALTANATEVPAGGGGCDRAAANLYEWDGRSLELINVLPGQTLGTPGATLAASLGALSAGGDRVYWSQGGNLYLGSGAAGVEVDASVGGGGSFEAASADGAVAYFSKAGHLYRFAAAATATSADLTPAGGLIGVLGAAADGSGVYYLDGAGVELWRGGATQHVAAAADPSSYPPASATARVSADGRVLAFLSSAPLSDFDNAGRAEVYRYDAESELLACISCNPSGERPLGPASLPPTSANGAGPAATLAYRPRALSADGNRVFFDSEDSLAPQDTNNDGDVYQWEQAGKGSCQAPGGCLALLSSGRAEGGARFIDASADGEDVFFLTDGSLLAEDPGSVDLYDARVGGGLTAATPPPPECDGDSCQPLPPEPDDPTPGTVFSGGLPNPPLLPAAKAKKKKKHHHHRPHRHRSRAR